MYYFRGAGCQSPRCPGGRRRNPILDAGNKSVWLTIEPTEVFKSSQGMKSERKWVVSVAASEYSVVTSIERSAAGHMNLAHNSS